MSKPLQDSRLDGETWRLKVAERGQRLAEESEIGNSLIVLDEAFLLHLASSESDCSLVDSQLQSNFFRACSTMFAWIVEVLEAHLAKDQYIKSIQARSSVQPRSL